ncbi:hypothetical protein [Caballeronia sp. DA-9]|uniref:hypothetical protein n=1 Tax=Caballeronia sp. DA-9 TaxID=3436237 RepID=UPI003F675E9A
MLLPTAAATARAVSLQNHMALVALRSGRGNIELAGELLKTVYLTYFLCAPDHIKSTSEKFLAAELALKSSILDSTTGGEWRLSDALCHNIEAVLCLHDAQLASVPVHQIAAAKERLSRVLQAGSFPDMAATHLRKSQ